MANHLHSVLSKWYPRRNECSWVLATVINIQGSNYRKLGAMMLIDEWGSYHGLISGGCLEKALLHEVKKVLTFDQPRKIIYDSREDSDVEWSRALGCGGKITLLLQPVNADNQYQQLDLLFQALQIRSAIAYRVNISEERKTQKHSNDIVHANQLLDKKALTANTSDTPYLLVNVQAQIHLAIFGGGIDAIPMVQMANIMGWQVTLIDHRIGYAKEKDFSTAQHIVREQANSVQVNSIVNSIDAAIVMSHNIEMDAVAIQTLQHSSAVYIGLLGPEHRKQKVFTQAGIVNNDKIYGPMGIDIGGDLPESIALATLAQCHQVLDRHINTKAIIKTHHQQKQSDSITIS